MVGFRRLGYNLFWKGLVRAFAAYLADTYGDGWILKPHKSKEGEHVVALIPHLVIRIQCQLAISTFLVSRKIP